MAYRYPISKEHLQKYEKETLQIKESLEMTFDRFDQIKDWSNLVKQLKRFIKLFTNNHSPFIPHKQHLFRRLAQCLTSVPDIAVHQNVIDIYILILQNLQQEPNNIINDTPYLTLGLFSYTQTCANIIKTKIIEEIYIKFFIPLGYQMGPMIIPLIGSLLPGLIDNNEQMRIIVFNFFDSLQKIFPLQLITLSVWTCIQRSPRCRYGGFLYMNYLIQKNDKILNDTDLQQFENQDQQDDIQIQKEKLNFVKNEKIDDIENVNDNIQIQKVQEILPLSVQQNEELMNELKIVENDIIKQNQETDDQLKEQVESHLKDAEDEVYQDIRNSQNNSEINDNEKKNNNSNINNEISDIEIAEGEEFEHNLDEFQNAEHNEFIDNQESEENEDNEGFEYEQNMKTPKKTEFGFTTQLSSVQKIPQSQEVSSQMIQQQLEDYPEFKESPVKMNPQFQQETLEQSVRESFMANDKEWEAYKKTTENNFETFQEKIQQYDELYPRKDVFIEAITISILDEQTLVKKRALDFIINYVGIENNKPYFTHQDFSIITFYALKNILNNDLGSNRRVYKYIFGPETDEDDVDLPEVSYNVLIEALKKLMENENPLELIGVIKILQGLFNHSTNIILRILKSLNIQIFETLVKISQQQQKEEDEEETEQGDHLNQTVKRFLLTIQSYLTEFISEYVQNDSTNLKSNVIEMIIKYNKDCLLNEQKNLVLFGLVKLIINQLQTEDSVQERQFTMKILTRLLDTIDPFGFQMTCQDLGDLLHLYLNEFEKFTHTFKQVTIINNIKTLEKGLIFSIWILLYFKEKQLIEEWVGRIEKLLSHVSKQPKTLLASIKGIQKLFELNKEDQNIEDIQMFQSITESIFDLTIKKSWELLDNVEFHNAAISLIFQLNQQNKEKICLILNKSLESTNQNVSIKYLQRLVTFWKLAQTFELTPDNKQLEKFVIFKLLEFLEDLHPIKRQIAKSWLIDSNEYFQNIIDYLIISLLNNSNFYFSYDGNIYHYEKYDTVEVMRVYTRLKHLITNNQSQFIRFMNKVPISDKLLIEMFQTMTPEQINQHKFYYQIILELLKKFMQSQSLAFFGEVFRDENILVQTSSCETLEILINCLAVSNQELVDKELLRCILKSYFLNVTNNCQVMQIHLLNLLKLLIFNLKPTSDFNIQKVLGEFNILKKVLDSLLKAQNVYTLVKILDFIQKIVTEISKQASETYLLTLIDPIFHFYYNYYINNCEDEININSAKIIFNSLLSLIKQYCSLDVFKIQKDEQEESRGLMSLFSWKKKPLPQIDYPIIEEFLIKNLDKILQLIIHGWEIQAKRKTAETYNIGIKGIKTNERFSGFSSNVNIHNEEFLEIVEKIFYKYKDKVFEQLLKVWTNYFAVKQNQDKLIIKNESIEKLIDIFLFLNLKIDNMYTLIEQSNAYKNIQQNLKKQQKNTILWENSLNESSLLAFIYSYLRFKEVIFIEDKTERRNVIRKFWTNLMSFLKNFIKSNHPWTKIWILNIFYMASKKYSVQEIINEYGIFRNLHDLENGIIEQLLDYVLELLPTNYETPTGSSKYNFVFPFPAKLVDIVLKNPSLYSEKLFFEFSELKYIDYFYKILTLYAIQKIAINLLLSTYESKKTYHIAKRLATFILKAFTMLQKEAPKNQMNEKIHEEIIKLVHGFLFSQKDDLFKIIGKEIKLYFDSNYFFQVSQAAIDYQKDMIKWYTNFTNNEILQIYLKNMNFSSLFKSKSQEQKVRFQSFYRLCFILYSGEKGTLLDKGVVKFLFSQIRDVIKNYQSDSILLIMMFFCIRIIIIRTTEKLFVEMFPLFFPVLYELLTVIFLDDTKLQDLNLKVASLKLIEMLLINNYEGIWNYYWNFGIDSPYFEKVITSDSQYPSFTSQFPFIPFFSTIVKEKNMINYYKMEQTLTDEYFKLKNEKRNIVIVKNNISDEIELSELTLKLMFSFSEFSRMQLKIDDQDINDLILNDFVTLNELAEIY